MAGITLPLRMVNKVWSCKKCEGSIKNSRVCFANNKIYSRVTFGIFNYTDPHVAVSKLRIYDSRTYYMVLMISLFTLLEA